MARCARLRVAAQFLGLEIGAAHGEQRIQFRLVQRRQDGRMRRPVLRQQVQVIGQERTDRAAVGPFKRLGCGIEVAESRPGTGPSRSGRWRRHRPARRASARPRAPRPRARGARPGAPAHRTGTGNSVPANRSATSVTSACFVLAQADLRAGQGVERRGLVGVELERLAPRRDCGPAIIGGLQEPAQVGIVDRQQRVELDRAALPFQAGGPCRRRNGTGHRRNWRPRHRWAPG